MERHKLWNDRAEKLMRQTFESWSKGKKKKAGPNYMKGPASRKGRKAKRR